MNDKPILPKTGVGGGEKREKVKKKKIKRKKKHPII